MLHEQYTGFRQKLLTRTNLWMILWLPNLPKIFMNIRYLGFTSWFPRIPLLLKISFVILDIIICKTRMTKSTEAELKTQKNIYNTKPSPIPAIFTPLNIAFFSNSRWQHRKQRPKRSTNNGVMVDKAKRDVASKWGS